MSIRDSAEICWSLRIEALFNEAIERLWFAEGKETRRMVLELRCRRWCFDYGISR